MSDPVEQMAPRMNRTWLLVMGVLLIVGGLVAFSNVLLASLVVVIMAAAFFLVAGGMQLWLALRNEQGGAGARWIAGILGVLMILFALSLFVQPLAGMISLTILLAGFFIATGLVRIFLSMRMREHSGWGWLLASGILSVALGLFIMLALGEAALGILGVFLGVELIVSGAAMLTMGMRAAR